MYTPFIKRILAVFVIQVVFLGTAQAGLFSNFFTNKNYAKTRYPIVTVGGFLAFDSMLGVEYFYGIADDLRKNGAVVYESDISEFQSNEYRGEELLEEIENYLTITGYKKVNIFAHSQGSTAARYVASVRPDLVASVTSIHGMNRGTQLADSVRGFIPKGSFAESFLEALTANVGGPLFELLSGDHHLKDQSAIAVMDTANTIDAKEFNKIHSAGLPSNECGRHGKPVENGVYYWSWGGVGGWLSHITNGFDLIDTVLLSITPHLFPKGVVHDGIVPLCGQYLGKPIRHNYRHNHFDAQRQLLGLRGVEIDPKTLYRNQANRLKNSGL